MTAQTAYKKELFSLPIEVSGVLKTYAQKTHKKKSHIVAEAITEYVRKRERRKLANAFKSRMGLIHADTPDIQEIKAGRDD